MKYKKGANGLYKASVYLGKKADGKENRKYVYAKTQKELEEKLAQIKYMNIVSTNATFGEVAEKWFALKQENNSYATKTQIQRILKNNLYPTLRYASIDKLKTYHIQSIISDLLKEGKTDIVRKTLQVTKSIFNFAVDNDVISKNIASPIKLPTFHSKEKRPLTEEERKKIENSSNKYRDFFMVLLYTGMRKGEITALTWEDIKKDHIVVNKSATFIHNQAVIKSTKNGKPRNIPLLDKIRPIFNSRGSGYVFTKADGEKLSDVAIKRMLESFRKDTGLDFTLHQLRHTFCTLLYYSGISSKKTQEIMGHSSLEHTLKIYTHLDDEKEGNISDKLNAFLEK